MAALGRPGTGLWTLAISLALGDAGGASTLGCGVVGTSSAPPTIFGEEIEWVTSVPCHEPLQTDCISFPTLAHLCPPQCPYAVQHAELTCVFECVTQDQCGLANPEYVFANNVTHVCEPCNIVGCRRCASRDICLDCFDSFLLTPDGSFCLYVWDARAQDGMHAAVAFGAASLLLVTAVLAILDRCLGLRMLPQEVAPTDIGVDEANSPAHASSEYDTDNENDLQPQFESTNSSKLPSRGLRVIKDLDMDVTSRAINSGKRHRLRCKIKDLEILDELATTPMNGGNGSPGFGATHAWSQSHSPGGVAGKWFAKVRSFPLWLNLRSRFLVGVGLPLFHQWFPFLAVYSLLMASGTYWVYHGSDLSRLLHNSGLARASQVLFQTSAEADKGPLEICDLRGEEDGSNDMGYAVRDFGQRAAIGYFILWLLGLCLSLAHAARQRRLAAEFHGYHPCLAEFALLIEGFPPDAIDEEQIRRFLRRTFQCDALEVSICYNFRDVGCSRVFELFDKVLQQKDIEHGAYEADLVGESPYRLRPSDHQCLSDADREEVCGWLDQGLDNISLRNAGGVFAIFPHLDDVRRAKRLLEPAGSQPRPVSGQVPMLPHSDTPEWLFLQDAPLIWKSEGTSAFSSSPSRDCQSCPLTIREVACEPPDVVWENVGSSKPRVFCRLILATTANIGLIVLISAALFVPLARYNFEYVYQSGSLPKGAMMTVLGTLGMAATWIICLSHIQIGGFVGFTRRDREALLIFMVFSALILVQNVFNIAISCFPESGLSGENPLRFLLTPLTEESTPTLQEVAWQARASVDFFHVLVPGGLFFGYLLWPLQGFVWPFVSTIVYLRLWFTRPWSSRLTAREAEIALEPLGLSLGHDYMGSVVQPALCSFAFFFASGVTWQMFVCLAGWALFMIIFQRYLHLRAVRRCFFTTNRLDTQVLFSWGVPLSMVLAASAFWAARLQAWPMQVVPVAWACGFLVWAVLLAVFIRPLSLPKHVAYACNRPTYEQVCAKRFYDWHNCNPIKVLLSHSLEGRAPITPFQVGKEYLQASEVTWFERKSRANALDSSKDLTQPFLSRSRMPGMPELETLLQGVWDCLARPFRFMERDELRGTVRDPSGRRRRAVRQKEQDELEAHALLHEIGETQ